MKQSIIIFDMDGTLYDLDDVVSLNYEMQIDFLCKKTKLSEHEAVIFLAEHHVYPIMKKDSMSATELFFQMGLNKKEWSDYRDRNFDVSKIDITKVADEQTVERFKSFGNIILLTSNTSHVVEKVLSHLKISISVFDEIICSDRFPYDIPFKKQLAMKFLSESHGINYTNMYSIGDRYSTDILPILELGGKGILVSKPKYLSVVADDFMSETLMTRVGYCYYE